MPGTAGQRGYLYKSLTANGTTTLGQCGINAAQAGGNPLIEGFLATISIGADSTATTITVFDNTAGSGTVAWKMVTPTATVPLEFHPNIQVTVGMTIVIANGTSPTVNVAYA